ncbi:hypothetical protein DV515_00003225, partial [Chloebia gouldiae]
ALPHPPPPPLPRPRGEPGSAAAAAAAGRTAPLPRPAAAAQHRPAGGEARRSEPSGGATGRGERASRLGADRLAGTLRLPVEPVATPSAGSSEGRCTHHPAPFSLRERGSRPSRRGRQSSCAQGGRRPGPGLSEPADSSRLQPRGSVELLVLLLVTGSGKHPRGSSSVEQIFLCLDGKILHCYHTGQWVVTAGLEKSWRGGGRLKTCVTVTSAVEFYGRMSSLRLRTKDAFAMMIFWERVLFSRNSPSPAPPNPRTVPASGGAPCGARSAGNA